MATTFDVIFLGNIADLDPTEGNSVAENAGAIVGSTFGSSGDPLYDYIRTFAPGSTSYTSGANATGYDTDNSLYNEQFTIDGGSDQTMDAAAEYSATITYLDGTTATFSAILFQDTVGNIYLAPETTANLDQGALEAHPIQSMTLDALADDTSTLAADRDAAEFDAVVDGTSGDDSMGVGDTDADGDAITTGDDYILAGDGNDVITAGPGDDTIDGGTGDDTIIGGGGADTIDGGADNDVIYGDGDTVRESLNWQDLTTAEVRDGVTVNTGNVDVTFTSPTETGITLETLDTAAPYTGGIVDDGSGVDPDSVLKSNAADSNSLGEYEWSFSEPVTNVSFNIVDVDFADQVQILAFDANGNPVDVVLTAGSNVSVSDSNGDGIDDLAEGSGDSDGSDASNAVTVSILGPVSTIEAVHTIDGVNLGIWFTEMFFDVDAPDTYGDADSIDGGAGSDIIYGEGGDDTIAGGTGNDTVDGGAGSDTFLLGNGYGGDSITGGEDAGDTDTDVIDASGITADGIDVVLSGSESGAITSTEGTANFVEVESFILTGQADTFDAGNSTSGVSVDGGSGNDSLIGGQGDDTLHGGSGDDAITGGAGADSITGGAGNDSFTYSAGDGADTITDFNTGNTGALNDGDSTNNDFVDLSAFYDHIDELHADQADDGILNQSNDGVGGVDYSDNTQFAPGDSLTFTGASADGSFFTNENTGVVCFVRGTRILTPKGEVEIQKLRAGDRVITQDNGPQKIRWIGSSRVPRTNKLQPIRIARGALGDGIPNRTLFVSPQHRMLIRSQIVERMIGAPEVFIIAKKLTDMRGIHPDTRAGHVHYFHILCDRHEIVFANGAPTETLLPGPQAKRTMGPDAWKELTAVFPRIDETLSQAAPARPVIRGKLKDNLTRRHRRNRADLVE